MSIARENLSNGMERICEVLIEQGLPGLREAMETLLNLTFQIERERALGAAPYERSEQRVGYANGFKERSFQTRMGSLNLEIPQTRGVAFYPQSLEKGLRSERALKLSVAEMYLQGVSTRKVKEITEALCGYSISSTEVSRVSQSLDEELSKWRSRRLGSFPFVFVDARYEKVRHEGCVRSLAVLWGYGINPEGKREVLGVSVSLSEAEVHWRSFFEDLQTRGLSGVLLLTSDNHSGLKAARQAVFPSIPWQRCQFHISQNAMAHIPREDMKKSVAQQIRDIFNAPTQEMAAELLKKYSLAHQERSPKLALWMQENVPEGFAVYRFPENLRKSIRTTNGMERMNREIKRRTRVATLFPNEASCLRLISAILMEVHEDWSTGKIYLNLNNLNRRLEEN